MHYEFSPISVDDVGAIVSWRYHPPYDFYDMDSDPEDLALFTNPINWDGYYAVFDGDGERVGFFSFELDDGTLEIGLGMRPDLTGDGHGRSFVEAGLAFAREEYGPEEFLLSVATFNERAISVYEEAGFERVEMFLQETNDDEYPFVRMRRDGESN